MCTGIKINAKNGTIIFGRTLEFGLNIDSKIIFVPRNHNFIGTTSEGQNGLQWKTKYAAIGANASGVKTIIDGVNEAGLAGGLFYFPEYAKYQDVKKDELQKSIAPWELMTWILTNFATIEEVKNELQKIKVSNTIFKSWAIIPPIHAIVHDEKNNSLVIEYINGNLIMTENPLGVFTNSPSFDWHITNLRNYINLSALNVPKIELKNIKLTSLGQGSGMLGLPGDFTSPSRFVRATAYSQSIVNIKNEQEAIFNLFHILNLFDIPYGSVRQLEKNSNIDFEYTQWTSGVDLKNRRYYFHTYQNRNLRFIDLMKMDLNSKDYQLFEMNQKEIISEIKE